MTGPMFINAKGQALDLNNLANRVIGRYWTDTVCSGTVTIPAVVGLPLGCMTRK